MRRDLFSSQEEVGRLQAQLAGVRSEWQLAEQALKAELDTQTKQLRGKLSSADDDAAAARC